MMTSHANQDYILEVRLSKSLIPRMFFFFFFFFFYRECLKYVNSILNQLEPTCRGLLNSLIIIQV